MAMTEPDSTSRRTNGRALMTRRGRVMVLASACLVSATMAMVQFRPLPQPQSPVRDDRPLLASSPATVPVPNAPAPRSAARKTAPETHVADVTEGPVRPATVTTLPAPVPAETMTIVKASASLPEEQTFAAPSTVTISGCLEQDDERFRLKDTAGEDAPRSRSWRSAFLRRDGSTIDVVDQSERLHLPTYVGQRVSVTGTLIDKEMQVRSVSIVAESCQEKSA